MFVVSGNRYGMQIWTLYIALICSRAVSSFDAEHQSNAEMLEAIKLHHLQCVRIFKFKKIV